MDDSDSTRDRVFVVLLVIAVFGALIWIRIVVGTREQIETNQQQAAERIRAPSPPVEPSGVQHEPVRTERKRSIARIFECERDGQRVLSDQPCGSDAQVRMIDAPNRMRAQDTSQLYEREYARSPSSSGSSRPVRTDRGLAARCAQIEVEIERIDAVMRRGYKGGDAYRERLRQLKAERWDIECRWVKTPTSQRN
jgi:hypothetical protein